MESSREEKRRSTEAGGEGRQARGTTKPGIDSPHAEGRIPGRQPCRGTGKGRRGSGTANDINDLAQEKRRRLTGGEVQLRLEQTAYLTIWMQQDKDQRQAWEREQPDEEGDIHRLAKEIQSLDEQLGDGATVQGVRSQLQEWGKPVLEEEWPQERAPETPRRMHS